MQSIQFIQTIQNKQSTANQIFLYRLISSSISPTQSSTTYQSLHSIIHIPSHISKHLTTSLQLFIQHLHNIHIQTQSILSNQPQLNSYTLDHHHNYPSFNINQTNNIQHNTQQYIKPPQYQNNNYKYYQNYKQINQNQNQFNQEQKKIYQTQNLKYYQNKQKKIKNYNKISNPQFIQIEKKKSYMKSQTKLNKSIKKDERSSLYKHYQKMLKISKIDPQLFGKNLEKKKKQVEEKFMSNIQFLNRIKGVHQVKTLPKQWKQQIKINYKQSKYQNRHKIQEIGFSNIPSRKSTNFPSNSVILPKIQKSPKKYELDKPILFNIYNVNRKLNQIYSLK